MTGVAVLWLSPHRWVDRVRRSRGLAAALAVLLLGFVAVWTTKVYLPLLDPTDPVWGKIPKAAILEKFDRVRAVVVERCAPTELLDLTAPLQTVARRGEQQLYWIHDPHWNRAGHAAVAGIVARYLREVGVR